MRKIINNRVYDTSTAREVGYCTNHYQPTDFSYTCDTLYCNRARAYFLHCYGGPLSKYAIRAGNNSGWGEYIYALSWDEAREWAEINLTAEEYEKEFGIVDEVSERNAINVNLSESTISKLNMLSSKLEKSISVIIDEAVEKFYIKNIDI